MPWVRLDDRFPSHRKVSLLSDRAFRLYVSALCWASENLTEGLIRDEELRVIAHVRGMKAAANELVSRELWERVDVGWQIHDFLEYNPDRARVEADRERNAARQQAFRDRKKAEREARKAAQEAANQEGRNGVTTPSRNGPVTAPPSRPVPPPLPEEEEEAQLSHARETPGPALDATPALQPLANALHHAGLVGLGWDVSGTDAIRIEALIKAKGVPAMVQRALNAAERSRTPVAHVRYFLGKQGGPPGPWMDLPTITEQPGTPVLRAVPGDANGTKSRQQQEVDDWTERAHARALARMQQQKETS